MPGGWDFDDPSLWRLAVMWMALTAFAGLYISVLVGLVILILETFVL